MTACAMRGQVEWILCAAVLCGSVGRADAAESAQDLSERAVALADRGERDQAIRVASQAMELNPRLSSPYKTRGREYFRAGQIAKSLADLDRYAELEPQFEPQQWERGIAYYYAGAYRKGAEQFERYQTFDGHDVENSVWRFLCMVPLVGVKEAQKQMLPIEGDRRIPMMKAYEMFRGECLPEDVLSEARSGQPNEVTLKGRLFYTHLYLGLWFDANGKREEAARYMDLAADKSLEFHPGINRYMWDVARIHQLKLRGKLEVTKQ